MSYIFKDEDIELVLSVLSIKSTTADKVNKLYDFKIKNTELLVMHTALGLLDASTDAAIYAYNSANNFKIEEVDFRESFLPHFKEMFLPVYKLISLLKPKNYNISPGVLLSLAILRSENLVDDSTLYKFIDKYLKNNKVPVYQILECLNIIMSLLLSSQKNIENEYETTSSNIH